jgi:hypothetical protein
MINAIWIWWTINIFKLLKSIIYKCLPYDKRSKPFKLQFFMNLVMMPNVKHHDKVTFVELLFSHLFVKKIILLSLHNFNVLVGFQL